MNATCLAADQKDRCCHQKQIIIIPLYYSRRGCHCFIIFTAAILNHLKPSVDGAAGLKINASAIDWDNYTVQLLCLCCVHPRAALLRDVIYYQVEMLKPELTSSQAQGNWSCLLEHLCNCVMAKVARRRKKKKKRNRCVNQAVGGIVVQFWLLVIYYVF